MKTPTLQNPAQTTENLALSGRPLTKEELKAELTQRMQEAANGQTVSFEEVKANLETWRNQNR